MQIDISILHHDYPTSVRSFVEEKLENLAKYFDRADSVHALLEKQHGEHRVEIVARVPRSQVLKVDSRGETFGEAFDGALERMKRLLSEHKQKLSKVQRRKARAEA